MLACFSYFPILFVPFVIVDEFINATNHVESIEAKCGNFFSTIEKTSTKYPGISGKNYISDSFRIEKRPTNTLRASTISRKVDDNFSNVISSILPTNDVRNSIHQETADNVRKQKGKKKINREYPIKENYASKNTSKKYFSLKRKKKFTAKNRQRIEPLKIRTINLTLPVAKNQHRKNVSSIYVSRMKTHCNTNEIDNTLKKKRNVMDMIMENRRAWKNELDKEENNFGESVTEEFSDEKPVETMVNSTSNFLMSWYDFNKHNITENPWPLVPGPISCDIDFQLEPSFVAKLGEFDYVVSVQRQQNPGEPAEHVCTGVIYNPRFVVIAPHCLHDNYDLTVASTDDLCTIDETIDVDYVIEHENYDAETRKHDIALIKLKSEIHKKAAKFPRENVPLGRIFYAVGFGELMWKSFPKSVGKLLQKVPVQRYPPKILNESPGTLHITTSHMDLTGVLRGDLGGALINLRGEFVGLKSKFVKRSTKYEIYTTVRTYLPWIKSMVALHGSW